MDEKNDVEKIDDIMLPGFRFHPTDEELVGFYLIKKIQQKPLPIELIKPLDIYKYDPWDLPQLASAGEKQWYFYCPRNRKYRNSARPNRVTSAGFWKATGTDRPIYSSDGTKCIGLKKSLVFYRGRAARGVKTDWMMHEFRLPSESDSSPTNRLLDRSLPANDSWAICRIFKKAGSLAQRALSDTWISPICGTTKPDMFTEATHQSHFSPENIPSATETASGIQLCSNDLNQPSSVTFSSLRIPKYRTCKPSPLPCINGYSPFPNGFMFSPQEISNPNKCTEDGPSMLFNMSSSLIGDIHKVSKDVDLNQSQQLNEISFSLTSGLDTHGTINTEDHGINTRKNEDATQTDNQWGSIRMIGFPFSLPNTWNPDLQWDSPPCPSETSTIYSTSKAMLDE